MTPDIAELRVQIVAIQAELATLSSSTVVPKSVALQRWHQAIETCAQRVNPQVLLTVMRPDFDLQALIDVLDNPGDALPIGANGQRPHRRGWITAVIAAILPTAMYSWGKGRIEQGYAQADLVMPEADRQARHAELEAELLELEQAEEVAIRQAEGRGESVCRRGDVTNLQVVLSD
jgi:hypothetical protein